MKIGKTPWQPPPERDVELLGWKFRALQDETLTVSRFPGYWALNMARYSNLAYTLSQRGASNCAKSHPHDELVFTAGHISAIGCMDEGYRCLVFRGTRAGSLRDWMTDSNIWLTTPFGVHKGFHDAWDAIRPKILPWLQSSNAELMLGGHSLGGALAILAAFDLSETFPIAGVVTFGAPKVGGHAFRTEYERRRAAGGLQLKDVTRRIDHGDDTIPSLPPLPLYRHVGQGFELPVIELPVFAPPRNPFCPPTPAAEATDFVNQFLPAATAGIPDLLPNPRFKNKMPGVAALFALLMFWLYYYFLPRASSLASDLSHSVGGRQFWMVLSGAVLAALGHQLTYFASVPMRNIVRWPSALACSCAIVMLYPAAATVAAWAAVLLVVVLIATLRFITPGAALDHPIWKRYMSALSCSTLTTGPGASLVYGALGLKSRAL